MRVAGEAVVNFSITMMPEEWQKYQEDVSELRTVLKEKEVDLNKYESIFVFKNILERALTNKQQSGMPPQQA